MTEAEGGVGFRLLFVMQSSRDGRAMAPTPTRPVCVRLEVEVEVEGITRRTTRKEGRKMVRYITHTY